MKIAYLLHTDLPCSVLYASINELIKQKDHVFVMVNSDKDRDEVTMHYGNDCRVHISRTQQFAQEGDMSLARGTLLQIRDSLESDYGPFDYYINLYDGMLPLKSRDEIVHFLEENHSDCFYIDRTEKEDPSLRKKTLKYYPYTNLLSFPTKKSVRRHTRNMASFLNLLHIRRKLDDTIEIGSPWFILTEATAKVLADKFAYCSSTFKLSWYAEEMYLPMMIHKFMPQETHINKDYRAVGPEGSWQESQGIRPITKEVLSKETDALFGGAFLPTIDEELYAEVLVRYNAGYSNAYAAACSEEEKTPESFNKLVNTFSKKNKDEENQ